MAAMLIEIKSRMLLPPQERPLTARAEDPRAELVRRLIEYEQIKLAAAQIDTLPLIGRDFLRAQVTIEQSLTAPRFPDVDADDLRAAWADILNQHHHQCASSSRCASMSIVRRRGLARRCSMICSTPAAARRVLVVTFIAMLELARAPALRSPSRGLRRSTMRVGLRAGLRAQRLRLHAEL